MNIWGVRFGALVVALAISAVVFYFWGQFAAAMKAAMEVPVVSTQQTTQPTGEVSVSLPRMPKNCPKGQSCK
jgi:hypothetical protein